ncbi:MAG: DUF5318 domain-containing protein [Actinomycetia bacterium]|nr:DUF5318 domain-containing protein [Actinomycetes bacterium]
MVPPHHSVPKGTRVGAGPRPKPAREPLPDPEDVVDPTQPRQVVDYAMKRRAALRTLLRQGLHEELCDADPMLLRTAKWHGERSDVNCPVCRKQKLTHLTYTFGAEMGETSGRVRSGEEVVELAHEYGAFRVYVVEVCERCSWNHLVLSYVLGDGRPRIPARRTKKAWEK